MVLGKLDSGAQRLVMVLCLPLIDGVFATLLVTGAVDTFSNVIVVALTIFTGAGALAVLYSHAESKADARRMTLQAAPLLILGAVAVALVAPIFETLFYVNRLQYAAALIVLVIAAQFLQLDIANKFSPHAVLLTGLVLSLKNPEALAFSFAYVTPALVTAAVAVAGLYAAASIDPDRLSIGYMQKGGAVVLVLIALSLFGLNIPSELTLGVFGTSVAAALR
jgi:hypothetical protein